MNPEKAVEALGSGSAQVILAVVCVGLALAVVALVRYIVLINKARIDELKLAMTTVAESNAQTAQAASEMTRTVEMLAKQGGGA